MSKDDHPLERHLDLVERVTRALGRRKCLGEEELEEFQAEVRLKMLEDDGAVLRAFRGDSSFKTYLTTVVTRLFYDFQRSRWGRWRPSAAAKRKGHEAVFLETKIQRDGLSFEEAAEMLRRNHGVERTVAELARLYGELPPRTPRRVEGDDALEWLGTDGAVESTVHEGEMQETARRTEEILNRFLGSLSAHDRFLVRSLGDGLQVSEVARMLGVEQKPLYRRRDRLRDELRRRLEEQGLDEERILDLVHWGQAELDVEYRLPVDLSDEEAS